MRRLRRRSLVSGPLQPPSFFPLLFLLYCLCKGQCSSGFPQPFAGYLSESDIPKNERLALCFSQWIELSDQPQVSSSVMDLCNSMFDSLQIDEENNQEIYKRFLFHYSRAQDPTYPLKAGESQVAAAEFTKKDGLDALGRPFFLFRPRNGRTVDNGGE
ncbi:neuromedin-S isoform X1 [Sceloporus undulatus]|uniref:neuromedin-S isoform X1 n=1 Tax=Sceloporus undulatus TaxID=8520 RepID=UPI001C4B7EAF|nr:neuromedin-S isoform X1 [Sceloporus undulatus]